MYNDKSTKSVADAVAKILEASTPKTEKEKDLAALGHPKDKITHKDVLIGRGVLKKEEAEQIDELSKKTLGNYISKAVVDVNNNAYWGAEGDDKDATNKAFKRLLGVKSAAARLSNQNVSGGRIRNFRREEVEETLPFTAMLESYAQGGMKAFFENFVVQEEFEQVEEEATSDEFVSELEKAKRKAAGKEKNEVSKAAVQAVQNEEVELDEADEKDVAKNVAKTRAERDYHASKLEPDAWKYGAFGQRNPEITKKLHSKADKEYGKALDDIKKTPVAKFLKTRKGDGKVRTEETDIQED